MGENFKVTNGIVSSLTGIQDDIRELQISVPIQPGNSGGPLFDMKGNIVGITTATLSEEAIAAKVENVNYAVKISYLLNLYNMLPDHSDIQQYNKNIALTSMVKQYKHYVCLIKVY
jgi:S1-C subfamily serine protease